MPNKALEPLSFLVGEWSTVGSHPMLPGKTLRGRTSFAWAEGGAFLVMRSEIDQPEVPSAVAYIGTDDDSRAADTPLLRGPATGAAHGVVRSATQMSLSGAPMVK
jgi:hypothetical protein